MRARWIAGLRIFVPPALLTALVLSWWLSKLSLFNGLSYTSDLFHALQGSYSYWLGRPLLFSNDFGGRSLAHNLFLLPLFAPLTYFLGAYGLFAATLLLNALSAGAGMAFAKRRSPPAAGLLLQAGVLLVFFGPAAFWLWDDPIYGWHTEILYLPLAGLFGLSLQQGSRLRWLWGALLVLNKEDGAVVACAVHLFVATASAQDWRQGWRVFAFAKIVVFWSLVFAAGMLVLRLWSNLGLTRLDSALAQVGTALQAAPARAELFKQVKFLALLWLSGSLILAVMRPRLWLTATLCTLPLLVLGFIGCVAYLGDASAMNAHGLLWPLRIAPLWALLGAAVCVGPALGGSTMLLSWRQALYAVVLAGCVVFQAAVLREARNYSVWERWRFTGRHVQPGGWALALTRGERQFLRCLAQQVPMRTPIALTPMLFAYFHRHDIVGAQNAQYAWAPAEMIICDGRERLPFAAGCSELLAAGEGRGFARHRAGGFEIGYVPQLEPQIRWCIVRQKSIQ